MYACVCQCVTGVTYRLSEVTGRLYGVIRIFALPLGCGGLYTIALKPSELGRAGGFLMFAIFVALFVVIQ